jgi:hypothetical protein
VNTNKLLAHFDQRRWTFKSIILVSKESNDNFLKIYCEGLNLTFEKKWYATSLGREEVKL